MQISSMELTSTSLDTSAQLAYVNTFEGFHQITQNVKPVPREPTIYSNKTLENSDKDVLASLLMLDRNLSDGHYAFVFSKELDSDKMPMRKRSKKQDSDDDKKSATLPRLQQQEPHSPLIDILYEEINPKKKKRVAKKIDSDEEEDWEDEKKPIKRKKRENLDTFTPVASDSFETPKKRRSRVKTENRVRNPPRKWTESDDVKLQSLVAKIPECNNRWTQIGDQLGRSPSECFQHWMRVLNPNINKGPWTMQEEECLCSVVGTAGSKIHWAKVAEKIPGRTDTQCRYQWTRIKRSEETPWLEHEDNALQIIMRDICETTSNWSEIANIHYKNLLKNHTTKYKTPPRPAIHCKNRWSLIATPSSTKPTLHEKPLPKAEAAN